MTVEYESCVCVNTGFPDRRKNFCRGIFYAAGLLAAAGSAGKSLRFFQFGFFSGSIQPENSTMVFRGSVTKPPEESGDCSRYSLGVRWITSWK